MDSLRSTGTAIKFVSAGPLLDDLGELDLMHLRWIVVGGELGLEAWPLQVQWVRAIRNPCPQHDMPFR
ncbi:MAG: DUF5131 family protein [Sedimentisphaerales bacterium]|nr:DUF5131 family protein [Sedimentisphaerales bacterium]